MVLDTWNKKNKNKNTQTAGDQSQRRVGNYKRKGVMGVVDGGK